MHFYALFPAILWLQRGHRTGALVALLAMAVLVRAGVWSTFGTVQAFSYFTLGGAIDLFLAGMLWHEWSKHAAVRRSAGAMLAGAALAVVVLWHAFNLGGGFYGTAASPVWILIPTLQGLLLGAVIVGYEHVRLALPPRAGRMLAKVGEVSYSIYLLHFLFFPTLVKRLALADFDMASPPVALGLAVLTFPLIVGVAMLSYRFIEQPFLRLRGSYERKAVSAQSTHGTRGAAPDQVRRMKSRLPISTPLWRRMP